MKKSFLLTVVMILMFSIQSYGATLFTVIDTVFIFDADNGFAPLNGDTIKAYKNGVLKTQNITSTQGSIHGRCILNVSLTTVGDTIKLVPVSPLGVNNTPIFTFKPTQITTVIRSTVIISNTNTMFDAYRNITSIAPAMLNPSKNNIANINNYSNILSYNLTNNCLVSIAYYDLQGRIIGKFINKNQITGNYSINFPIIGYARGTYLQVFKAGNYTKTGEVKVY